MTKKGFKSSHKLALLIILLLVIIVFANAFFHKRNIAVLNPGGTIASKQRGLIIFASILSLTVVIPVFTMTIFISLKYREGNKLAKYSPYWDRSRKLETLWWGIPSLLIIVLSLVTWFSSHSLDPTKSIISNNRPMTIQVVAMNWKWLFIYPKENVASLNYVQFPLNTPINFEITSDAAMNSFWIPQLGGQIYAMSGMSTNLHLMATKNGNYRGASANISGEGFAGMRFTAKASSTADYNVWLSKVKQSNDHLTRNVYAQLASPSQNNPPVYYASADSGLFDEIITKYMIP